MQQLYVGILELAFRVLASFMTLHITLHSQLGKFLVGKNIFLNINFCFQCESKTYFQSQCGFD